MPRPSACRISDAAAICTATEMRCMTKGTYLRVAHVASRSNSACVSRFLSLELYQVPWYGC